MIVYVASEEYFPCYDVTEGNLPKRGSLQVEMTPEDLADFRACMAAFERWQDRIRDMDPVYYGHLTEEELSKLTLAKRVP